MKMERLVPVALVLAGMTAVSPPLSAGEDLRSKVQAPPPTQSTYVKPKITHEPYGEVKVVVPLTSDDKGLQRMKLANINNSLRAADKWKGRFTVKVVLYGKGLSLLTNLDQETAKQVDTLRARGVQFMVCDNSLAALGIDFHTLHGVAESDIVPSGFAEVAYLQANQGYVADPAN